MVRSFVLASIQLEFLQEFVEHSLLSLLPAFEEEVVGAAEVGALQIALLVWLAFGMTCCAWVVAAAAGEEV